jgi:hypothetical protein
MLVVFFRKNFILLGGGGGSGSGLYARRNLVLYLNIRLLLWHLLDLFI